MFKVNDGALRGVEIKRSFWDYIIEICILMLFVCMSTFGKATEGTNYLYYITFAAFVGASSIKLVSQAIKSHKIFLNIQTIWYSIFIVLGITSAIWSFNFAYTFYPIQKMIQVLVITYFLQIYVQSEKHFEFLLDLMLISSVIMVVYIFAYTPVDEWFKGFLGSVTGYNTNSVGLYLSLTVMVSAYKGLILNKKPYLLITAILMFAVILTSSRKSLFMSILGIISLVAFNFKHRNYFLRLLLVVAIIGVIMFAIFNIPSLSSTIGVRLVHMSEYFKDDTTADSSLNLRNYYIQMGWKFFYEHPIKGIGLNNFAPYLRQFSQNTSYAHNNYVEIASGLGIIGLIAYYWFYAYLFIKLLKQLINGQRLAMLFFSFVFLILFFEYGIVSFYNVMIQTMLVISYMAVCINDTKAKQHIVD